MAKVIRKKGPGAARLEHLLAELDGDMHVKVGFPESAKYPDKNATPVAYVAVIQENGVEELGIPPRAFFAATILRCLEKWTEVVETGAKAVAAGKASARAVLAKLGSLAVLDVKQSIREMNDPPLAASTIKARERKMNKQTAEEEKAMTESGRKSSGKVVKTTDNPLQETEYMLNHVTFVVEDGKGDAE